MSQIEQAKVISDRILAVIGNEDAPTPNTAENVSRVRLLRVRTGLCHVLTEIMPGITASAARDELYAWLFEIHSITGAEECQARAEAGK
ncbi:transcriptional regulator [Escherichia coli]|uniref:transcriptional regulator n=1 Tax=Escherichia coli TaxID=562 RepID=UPI002F9688F9